MKHTRVVGVTNATGELICITLHDYYIELGISDQLDAIEFGYTNE